MNEKDTLYARWLSGELNPEEMAQLRSSGEIEELEAIIKATNQMKLPAYDKVAAFKKLQGRRNPEQGKVVRFPVKWIMATAASLAILVTAWFLLRPTPNTEFYASHGTNKTVDLMDGSVVILNDGSSLVYNEEAWETSREVELKGEALFKVSKGSDFVVKTKNGMVRVLGTEFNVRAWDEKLYVACYEGRVEVSRNGDAAVLSSNEAVKAIDGKMEREQAREEKPLWLGGSSFLGERIPIVEAFAEIERQFDVKIKNRSVDLTNIWVRGAFNHNYLDSALNEVCKMHKHKFTHEVSLDRKEVYIFE